MGIFIILLVATAIGLEIYRRIMLKQVRACGVIESNATVNMHRYQSQLRIQLIEMFQFTILGMLLISLIIYAVRHSG